MRQEKDFVYTLLTCLNPNENIMGNLTEQFLHFPDNVFKISLDLLFFIFVEIWSYNVYWAKLSMFSQSILIVDLFRVKNGKLKISPRRSLSAWRVTYFKCRLLQWLVATKSVFGCWRVNVIFVLLTVCNTWNKLEQITYQRYPPKSHKKKTYCFPN